MDAGLEFYGEEEEDEEEEELYGVEEQDDGEEPIPESELLKQILSGLDWGAIWTACAGPDGTRNDAKWVQMDPKWAKWRSQDECRSVCKTLLTSGYLPTAKRSCLIGCQQTKASKLCELRLIIHASQPRSAPRPCPEVRVTTDCMIKSLQGDTTKLFDAI